MVDINELALLFSGGPSAESLAAENPYLDFKGVPDQIGALTQQIALQAPGKFSTRDLIISSLASGLGSGVLGGLGKDYSNTLTDRYQQAVKQFAYPNFFEAPTEESSQLPSGLFGEAKKKADLFAAIDALDTRDYNRDVDKTSKAKLIEGMIDPNPNVAKRSAQLYDSLFGSKISTAPTEAQAPSAALPDVPAPDSPLATGKESTAQKLKAYYQDFVNQGMLPTQAGAAARQQVESEVKANTKTFDEAREAREYGQKLLDMAGTAEAGTAQAGDTGTWMTAKKAYDYVASGLGDQDAEARRTGRQVLGSIAPEVVKINRSPGAVSDFETRLYIGAGPNENQTPETNAILTQKIADLGKLNLDYADFLDAFREANSGSTVGAQAKWSEYRQAFPIFSKVGNELVLQEGRPSWQEYFAGAAVPTEATQSQSTGQVSQETMVLEAQALAKQGYSREQIAATLRAKYSGGVPRG